jgi:Zn-dependent peptidase ImmA (M78 family)
MVLKVFGQNVPVKKIKNLLNEKGLYGYYSHDEKAIYLDAGLKGNEYYSTLAHELFHSVFFRIGMEQLKISADAHEIMVDGFSKCLVENFKLIFKK